MPCHTRMKIIFLQGLLWLYLLHFNIVYSAIEPGYLDFDNLPDTNFSCVGKVIGGYYADLETNCQMFHVCTIGQLDEPMDIRFLCLNGTVFDQETRVCERVDEVDCSKSERFYHLNLELYGNTAPPILEDSDATKLPIISSTPSATTPRSTTTTRTTNRSFYTTSIPTVPPTTHATPKVITSNQFPVHSGPDIRFNPEEINIRLTPGSPPIIKSPSVSFQQQSFNGDSRISVTTHTSVFQDERTSQKNQPSTSSTQKPKSVVSYGLQHGYQQQQQPSYEFAYQQTENSDIDYHTDLPSSEYSYQEADNEQFESGKNYETTNVNNKQQQVFSASTTKVSETSPSSTSFPSSIKPAQTFNYQRTDKPPNLQLPVPGFPTLPPLTFSSPAPFSLQRHFEQKRSNDHQQRPRIIVSASASVSDASGRRLNYSLGTIGTSHIIGKAPRSYDDYKEDDVGLDPFYHDVPKVTKPRQKREVEEEEEENVAKEEEEENIAKEDTSAENHTETVHWTPPEYVDDNYEPLTYHQPENNTDSTVTSSDKNSTTSAEVDSKNTTESSATTTQEPEYEYYDYVDDNYEPSMYETAENDTEIEENEKLHNTSLILTSTESSTEPMHESVSQETTIEANTVTESMNNLEHTEQSTQYTEYISTTIASINTEEPTTEENAKEIISENEAIAEKSVDPETEEIVENKHTEEENEEPLEETINEDNEESINSENEHSDDKLDDQEENTNEKSVDSENENKDETVNDDNEDIEEDTTKQHSEEPNVTHEETTTEINTKVEHGRNIQFENHEREQVTTEYSTESETVSSKHYSHETQDTTIPSITESPTVPTIIETSTYITEPSVTENTDSDTTTSVYTYITNRQNIPENEHEELTTEALPTEKYTDHFITTQTTPESLPETTTEIAISTERAETTLDMIEHPTTTESYVTTEGLKDETVISEDKLEETTTVKETTTEIVTTSAKTTTSTTRYSYLRTREPYYKRYSRTRPTSRHRFSSPTIHMSPSLLKLHGNKLAAQIPSTTSSEVEETKSTEDTSRSKSTEDISRSKSIENTSRLNRRIDKQPELSNIQSDDVSLTDAPLSKSANPTEPKDTKVSSPLPTTPITRTYFIPRRFSYDSSRSFNCFGKKMNKFYEDPRDCRLFHYCTPGYSATQVLDMKFVCDFGTYFDSDKLICTKVKPHRCK